MPLTLGRTSCRFSVRLQALLYAITLEIKTLRIIYRPSGFNEGYRQGCCVPAGKAKTQHSNCTYIVHSQRETGSGGDAG